MSNVSNLIKFILVAVSILLAALSIIHFAFVQMSTVRHDVCIIISPDSPDISYCNE